MATMQGAIQAATEVMQAGRGFGENHEQASLKLALWASCLSAQKQLGANAKQVGVIRGFVTRGLPSDHETVYALVAEYGDPFLSHREIDTLYYVQLLEADGSLARFEQMPTTLDAWYEWREDLLTLLAGHGLSRKMVSFAALLMWPLDCQLVPCDRHVFARLHHTDAEYKASSKGKGIYLTAEAEVVDEWLAAGEPATIGIWHWYTWSAYRQAIGAETKGDACESHRLLSPYWY